MNTFISTKLGEVLAFARIGKETLAKGKAGFLKILDEEQLAELDKKFDDLESRVSALASQENVTKEVEDSAHETSEKVSSMRDTYIDGHWDEDSEVLEWTGFYTGASLVHWYLLSGASHELALTELEALSKDAITFYGSLFSGDEKLLASIGAENAK